MDVITKRVTAYLLHDVVGNLEGYITDYNSTALQDAEDAGMIVIAEYNDGSRERVKAADVVEPQPEINGVTLVQPDYVDERMRAVVNVFDAWAQTAAPKTGRTASLSGTAAISSEFEVALEKLKELVNGDA